MIYLKSGKNDLTAYESLLFSKKKNVWPSCNLLSFSTKRTMDPCLRCIDHVIRKKELWFFVWGGRDMREQAYIMISHFV